MDQELLQSLIRCVHGGKGNKGVAEQKGRERAQARKPRRAKCVHGKLRRKSTEKELSQDRKGETKLTCST